MKQCYNRGCGKKFDSEDNDGEDLCIFHPGAPFFHDAYKGWTCCNRKSTDFTMFLNFEGCTRGKHSNIKPVEPEKITGNLSKDIEINPAHLEPKRILMQSATRPRADSPLERVVPNVAPAARAAVGQAATQADSAQNGQELVIGESCKNGGCKASYSGDAEFDEGDRCLHHPGVPIFHEGMKFWSCCQRRTSEFQAFLNQEGCTKGEHKWLKENNGSTDVVCRYDWHQTGSKITVAFYCKKYDPDSSFIDVNPVRLKVHIFFPEQGGAYDLDVELMGVISAKETTVSMLGTKVEVQLVKAEPMSWSRLEVPKIHVPKKKEEDDVEEKCEILEQKVDTLDLDDLELVSNTYQLSTEASTIRP